jgi:hypothetical protein
MSMEKVHFKFMDLLNSESTLLSFLSESLKSTKRGNKEVKIILASVVANSDLCIVIFSHELKMYFLH